MPDSKFHIRFGWGWIFIGFCFGMILGLFAFNGPVQLPDIFMAYDSLPRRMWRLSHISFIGLGFLNWMYGVTLISLKVKDDKLVSKLLIIGSVTMPIFLFIVAFFEPFKYALAIPAVSLIVATFLFWKDLLRTK